MGLFHNYSKPLLTSALIGVDVSKAGDGDGVHSWPGHGYRKDLQHDVGDAKTWARGRAGVVAMARSAAMTIGDDGGRSVAAGAVVNKGRRRGRGEGRSWRWHSRRL